MKRARLNRTNDSTAKFYGWPPDGRYAAFLDRGINDPRGDAYAEPAVVDSARNTILSCRAADITPFSIQSSDTQNIQRATHEVSRQAAPALTRLKIRDGRGGTVVWQQVSAQNMPDTSEENFQAQVRGSRGAPA